MPRSATDRDGLGQSYGRSYSSEEMDRGATEYHPVSPGRTAVSGEGDGGRPATTTRRGPSHWPAVVLSVLGSAVAVAAVGCFCALVYPILKELRAQRVRGQDGTEERMLGFSSILVLSVIVGCVSCVFSWTLTYLNSNQPGRVVPTLTLAHFRDASGHGFHLGYGVAVLNGIMALLTVIWSLT
ncbi:ADP-ribosylation factor-like protein 6-interacting protein 6 [Sparus aurata]|uniref:ADP-ribosylation factor-like protein 6-interacting protein 6 n=1 Tax=Sparus aurata TaxID=8175 RepID=A0A671YDC8_SPAAU|nr:ADP-ribosylation factor-like protein 6-interacting protein 6 [Sparus aurata]